ncbi:MAG: class I SAM-dependent DNA methyltransferase [Rhodobacterales bacterium]|nr:class I SAM-dependent DNA methyltransferase [Rhodobacterales bacterium]
MAAKRDWKDVEPAIFGTLLERALEPGERARLGAHYTPRAYVERLVIPTIIEPLRADWEAVQARAQELHAAGDDADALKEVKDFHHQLCITRVLDPACGTGNFLYVSLELMKRLEGEVLEALDTLGEDQTRFAMLGETVSPHQFYGLELNPRAVPIADLVLWIGYLKWQLRTSGPDAITEPVLDAYGTIREQDAILAYDRQDLLRGEDGKPLSRWDGVTKKLNPITGEEIPDPDAQVPHYTYVNPRPAAWPEVEFIVGNPPFIGGKGMRAELGDGYADACWKVRSKISGGADFVMHFWDMAATLLLAKGIKAKPNPLRRFGFITTNSITQTFSRRVIERHMAAKTPLSLVFAVPDHPWLKASDKAAVRIAMTVAERGEAEGVLGTVISEAGLNTDTPEVRLEKREGRIGATLRIGADTSSLKPLLSNEGISSPGVKLHGSGFIVSPERAVALGLEKVPGLEEHILEYRNGRDLAKRPRNVKVIDLFSLKQDQIQERFPAVYQHVLDTVKPERDENSRASYRRSWWIFGEPRKEFRPVLAQLPRFVATVETSRHRYFQFLDANVRPDNMLICIGTEQPKYLAVLSSRLNGFWALSTGGWLGVGNDSRYSKSRTFDPFPFPACVSDGSKYELVVYLANLGERLDTFRKERLAAHDFLTMTGLYNVLERVRELDNGCDVPPLSDKERDIYDAGLVAVLKDIHDQIDRATFEAYGWEDLIPALVGKPGATTPSPHKTPEQEAAEEDLLGRLVALNWERAAEEARGLVRWLRPDYQIPKLGHKVKAPAGEQVEADLAVAPAAGKPKWPGDELDQIRAVREILAKADTPARPADIAAAFDGRNTAKRKKRVNRVLATLVAAGTARAGGDGAETRYFLPR